MLSAGRLTVVPTPYTVTPSESTNEYFVATTAGDESSPMSTVSPSAIVVVSETAATYPLASVLTSQSPSSTVPIEKDPVPPVTTWEPSPPGAPVARLYAVTVTS